jgi:hypothetical protein
MVRSSLEECLYMPSSLSPEFVKSTKFNRVYRMAVNFEVLAKMYNIIFIFNKTEAVEEVIHLDQEPQRKIHHFPLQIRQRLAQDSFCILLIL